MVHCVQIHAMGMQSREKLLTETGKHFFMVYKLISFNTPWRSIHKTYGAKQCTKFFN